MVFGRPLPPVFARALPRVALVIFGIGSTSFACSGVRGARDARFALATSGQPTSASGDSRPVVPSVLVVGAPPLALAVFDPAGLANVLEDPRLSDVHDALEAFGPARAAVLLAKHAAESSTDAETRAAWFYLLAKFRSDAGDSLGAVRAFDDASSAGGPLADPARFAAASLLEASGDHVEALTRLQAIQTPLGVARDVALLKADAMLALGDFDGAAAIWRGLLAGKKWPTWVGVAMRFSGALVARPSETHAEEAIGLARKVLVESAGGQGASEAHSIETQALAQLPPAKRAALEKLSGEELLARARALVASSQAREALDVTDGVLASLVADHPGELACEGRMVRAEALSRLKRKADAVDGYASAVEACAGLPRRAEALYHAGKSAGQAARWPLAIQRFEQLEKEFPGHRLADDARLRGARAALELGDEARFTRMLSTIAEDYPAGDLVGDGIFELALARLDRRDFVGAIPILQMGLKRLPRERFYGSAGRFPYFLGRALIESSRVEEGLALLARVVEEYPLSYYMALAHARLSEKDPANAETSLKHLLDREPRGVFMVRESPLFRDPAFVRSTWLVRVGEPKLARAELDTLGLSSSVASPELTWAAAFLLSRGGAAKEAHGLLRSLGAGAQATEVAAWLDHYPSGAWRAPWEVAYPRPFLTIVARESQRQRIPEALAYAIMREESGFDPRIVSPASAVGLMQLIVPTATSMGRPLHLPGDAESLKRPEVNVAIGCRYLAVLRQQFADSPLLAIPGYNAGGGAARRWINERPAQDFDLWVERIPYEETRLYTKRVITSMTAYEMLYAPDGASEARRTPLAASPAAKDAALMAADPPP